jgi:hypothetical protein
LTLPKNPEDRVVVHPNSLGRSKTPGSFGKLAEDDPRRCVAHRNSDGGRCGKYAIPGSTVCRTHGGSTGHIKRAAAQRMSEARRRAEAAMFLKKQGIPQIEDPLEEMLVLASEATAYREVFRGHLDKLLLADEVRYEHRAGEQLRAEVALWERAAERCLKIYEAITRLGIAERQTRIREAELMIIAEGIREILRRLELTPEQKRTAVHVVPEVLRELEAPKKID